MHGDASIGNLVRTHNGLLWNDLEDVCTGPVEWDLTSLLVSARIRGASDAFVEEFLEAYGGPQLHELSDFTAAHELYVTVWQAYAG
jgi:thiamine kinase-like enzyme